MDKKNIALISKEALEFAPRLLAIQESPPRKLPKVILYLVIILFFILLIWAMFGKLDIVATAEGKLIPNSYVKIVQPSDGGIVKEILVSEGDKVKKGDVLVRMDSTITLSDAHSVEGEMRLRFLQLRRIDAELNDKTLIKEKEDPNELFVQTKQQFQANRKAYQDSLSQEKENLKKTQFDLSSALEVLSKLEKTLPMYRHNADSYQKLAQEGYVTKIEAQEKERNLIEKEQDYRAQKANVQGLKASIEATKIKIKQITSNYKSKLESERSDTLSQYNRLVQEWHKSLHKTKLLELKAPQDGIIKDLATHTEGTVVSPGTVLMSLVPLDDPLQAEVMIKNKDAGFIHERQNVKVKLVAYPFQKYGMIEGEVMRVSADASQSSGQAPIPNKSDLSSQSIQDNVMTYKALIKLNKQHLQVDDKIFKLTAGMQTICEIHLGKRTVMEYLLSPIQKAWYNAGRER